MIPVLRPGERVGIGAGMSARNSTIRAPYCEPFPIGDVPAGAALAIATTGVALVHLWHLALLRERRSVAALSAGPDQPGPGSPGG
jgi:hypothetical protein